MKLTDLDFSGGDNSWFDLWHTHVDWDGNGNRNWEARLPYLNDLVVKYNKLKIELKHSPKDYQLWILIDEQDSAEDALYIHTRNPNANNFPAVVDNILAEIKNKNLKDFIDSLNMTVIQVDTLEGKLFYLYDEKVGVPLTKE
ncbi:hypothetical protein GXP67_24395 [Rhodocytophaga rosea]|uniref:Uncharacterized protein n=1 Tax=Rhodocytophaga rosea TaxID=2704465 RepID=A0A6C0GND3_9BACT|nr:hypothetical protein [Rhodocytophaga rosea]QHT69561.1 hypothetical protein GXP67_24395 [Rhodocytophaga rosea]